MPRCGVTGHAINNTKGNVFYYIKEAFQLVFYFPVEVIFRDSNM